MSEERVAKKLIFRKLATLTPLSMREIANAFQPHGRITLNQLPWREYGPRTCGVTRISGSNNEIIIEVEYRPLDWVSYVQDTKYVGWTAYLIDRDQEGTFLDGNGNILKDGEAPVLIPYEIFHDMDFNTLDFGDLESISEIHYSAIDYREIAAQLDSGNRVNLGSNRKFCVSHRSRPSVQILIVPQSSSVGIDGFGTRVTAISMDTPHLRQVVAEKLFSLLREFFEGKIALNVIETSNVMMIDLTSILVDCTSAESRFDCLRDYLPRGFISEMATRISSRYSVRAREVVGERIGLSISQDSD